MKENKITIESIGYIETDFPEKFGIPRQSGILNELVSVIKFHKKYRNPDALRGLEGYSHIWVIWEFSESVREGWQPMVHPPRLGGKTPMGVFSTRSPFRPNPLGLTVLKIVKIDTNVVGGPFIYVTGADLMNGTPIFDIKPYLPQFDVIDDAKGGFSEEVKDYRLNVNFPMAYLNEIPEDKRSSAIKILENDPRPSYHNDKEREYGLYFANKNILFKVDGNQLYVTGIEQYKKER